MALTARRHLQTCLLMTIASASCGARLGSLSALALESTPGASAAVLENFLRDSGSELVVLDFESLPAVAREAMLKTMHTALKHHVAMARLIASDGRIGASSILQRLKVIAKAANVSLTDMIQVADIVLQNWGIARPKEYQILQHERHLAQHQIIEKGLEQQHFSSTIAIGGTDTKPPCLRKRSLAWTELTPVEFAGLKIFQVAKNHVLSGRLIVDPIVNTGITTLLQDASGDVVKLYLYNQISGGEIGKTAVALAAKMFARGTRLSIAEPYYKIFVDGSRGIRIDDPGDLHIDIVPVSAPNLALALEEGDAFFDNRQFHAASFIYWHGLRSGTGEVASLLSNRAEAFLKQELWAEGLLDASAAIVLQPNDLEAARQYAEALSGLGFVDLAARALGMWDGSSAGEPLHSSTEAALAAVLDKLLLTAGGDVEELRTDGSVSELKQRGMEAYRAGRFGAATELFSSAISASTHAHHAAIILSNIATSALNTDMLHDSAAASAASLRLRFSMNPLHTFARALALLGLYDSAERLLQRAVEFFPDDLVKPLPRYTNSLLKNISVARMSFSSEPVTLNDLAALADKTILSEWFAKDAIEVVNLSNKGRGLLAKRDIEQHEVLIVQRPRGQCSSSERDTIMIDYHAKYAVTHPADVKTRALLLASAKSDALLTSTLSLLSDSSGIVPPVIPVGVLLNRLNSGVLPLLLQHPDFVPSVERVELSLQRIADILHANTFDGALGGGSRVELYTAISLLNHDSDPTCDICRVDRHSDVTAIVAERSIRAGEELTLRYHYDEAILDDIWGIKSN